MANNSRSNAAKAQPKATSVDIVANSKLLKDFQQQYNELHGDRPIDVTKERIVGRNGYFLGQQFHLTGEIYPAPVLDADGKKTGVYLALKTKENTDLSLAALMGVTSLRGYILEGTIKDSKDTEFTAEVTDKVKTQAAKNNAFNGWNVPTRDLYKMAAIIENDTNLVKDKVATFEGIALRTIKRRQATTDFNGVEWNVGDTSVITQRLWSVV